MKQQLTEIFLSSVQAAHPSVCLQNYLSTRFPMPSKKGKLFILVCGKASGAMAQELDMFFEKSENMALRPAKIVAVTRYGFDKKMKWVELMEAAHPYPDDQSVKAASYALDIADKASKDDIIWVILSGGASALWCAPIDGLSLDEKQDLTKKLLKSGATINEINAVRRQFSKIKAGGLLRAAHPAQVVTTAISDVVGDDLDIIGSGPTVLPSGKQPDPIAILKRFKIDMPAQLEDYLTNADGKESLTADTVLQDYALLANGQTMLDAAQNILEGEGYEVIQLGDRVIGEARDVAVEHADLVRKMIKIKRDKFAILSGGEVTVTVKGTGKGGSNQEYALALAIALQGLKHVYALSADSDGIDGGEGKEDDPAGAFVEPMSLQRAADLKLNPKSFLQNNDSGGFFEQLEGLILTGSTQTNVNDFRLILYDKTR